MQSQESRSLCQLLDLLVDDEEAEHISWMASPIVTADQRRLENDRGQIKAKLEGSFPGQKLEVKEEEEYFSRESQSSATSF